MRQRNRQAGHGEFGGGAADVDVVRLNMFGKAQVGGGVFVGGVEQGRVGQGGEPCQAGVEPFGTAAGEDAAAAGGKQGVAGKNVSAAVKEIAQMAGGMAGGVPDFGGEALPDNQAAFSDGIGGGGNVAAAADAAIGKGGQQLGNAGGVVAVGMGDPDVIERQAAGGEIFEYGFGCAGVDADDAAAAGNQPDVVVAASAWRTAARSSSTVSTNSSSSACSVLSALILTARYRCIFSSQKPGAV